MRTSLSALALLALVMTGCSEDGESSTASAAVTTLTPGDELPTPCDLSTPDEIAQLLDRAVGEPVADEFPDASLCTWASTEESSIGNGSFPEISIGLIQIGESNAGNRERLDEVLALASTDASPIADFDGVGSYRICEDSDAASPEACEAWDEFVLVYETFYLEINMTNYAWPQDYERARVAEIVEAVAAAAIPRI